MQKHRDMHIIGTLWVSLFLKNTREKKPQITRVSDVWPLSKWYAVYSEVNVPWFKELEHFCPEKNEMKPGVVVGSCDPRTQETEAWGLRVQDQPEPHNETHHTERKIKKAKGEKIKALLCAGFIFNDAGSRPTTLHCSMKVLFKEILFLKIGIANWDCKDYVNYFISPSWSWTYYVGEADHELLILLPPPPKNAGNIGVCIQQDEHLNFKQSLRKISIYSSWI